MYIFGKTKYHNSLIYEYKNSFKHKRKLFDYNYRSLFDISKKLLNLLKKQASHFV